MEGIYVIHLESVSHRKVIPIFTKPITCKPKKEATVMVTESQINHLREYTDRLSAMGYAPFQIREIIKEEIGVKSLVDLSSHDQYEKLLRVFEGYLKFAEACRSMR